MAHQRLFVVSNKRTFGLTESEILSTVHRGLKAMINFENRFAAKTKSEQNVVTENEDIMIINLQLK